MIIVDHSGPDVAAGRPSHARHAGEAWAWAQARRHAHALPRPLGAEDVPLMQAAGRTLARPVHAAAMLPGFDNAAMDGYAVRGPGPWRLTGRILAGGTPLVGLEPGEAAEVATGAAVPANADRVVEYEASRRSGDTVYASVGQRRHIRRAGEYAGTGEELLPAGTVLSAAALGLAASAGLDRVTVRNRPTARIIATGDEVVTSGIPPHGRVRDAIGPVLVTLLSGWAVDVVEHRWLPDRGSTELGAAIEASREDADLTIVCGSSSAGPADCLREALRSMGARLHIDGVACRPGHPQVLAEAGTGWVVGVPGNPFAALAAAFTVVHPLVAGLNARPLPLLPGAVLRGDGRPAAGNTRLVPVRWIHDEAQVFEGAHRGYLVPRGCAAALGVVPPRGGPRQTVDLLLLPV